MFSFKFGLLATAAVAVCASPAFAAVKSPDGFHSFSGGVKASFVADGNVGSAPAKPAGGADTGDDEDEDEDDFDLDEEMDDDALDDILDDVDEDTEDLAEDDAGDADGDGQLDLADDSDDDGDGEDELEVGGARGKGRGDGDERVQTTFALKHDYSLGKALDVKDAGIKWKSGFTYGLNNQADRHDLDRRNFAINTGPEFEFKSIGLKVNPSVTYLDLNVNDNSQMHATILSLGTSWKATKSLALSARYNHEIRNNLKPNATDVDVDGLKLGAKYVWGKNLFSAAISPKFESNDNTQKDKDKLGYELGYSRKLPWKIKADLGFKYGNSDFTDLTPGREDDDYQYSAKVTKNFTHGLYVDVGALHKSKDSNINSKDSNGQSFFVSTGWKF